MEAPNNQFITDTNKCIASGSYGKVYKGKLQSTGVPVAVKIAKSDGPPSLLNTELEFLKILFGAEYIVQILGWNNTGIALEMGLCSLADLMESIYHAAGLPQIILMDLQHDLLSGVISLKEKKVIHRDIKAENILVFVNRSRRSQYLFKLCDFGQSTCESSSNKTLVGTKPYLNPRLNEHYSGGGRVASKVDTAIRAAESDGWCAGITLFYAATNIFPFDRNDLKAVKALEIDDLDVTIKDGVVHHRKYLPPCRVESWFNGALSSMICYLFHSNEISDEAKFFSDVKEMKDALLRVKEKKFLSINTGKVFRYADIGKENYLLGFKCPSLEKVIFQNFDIINTQCVLLSNTDIIIKKKNSDFIPSLNNNTYFVLLCAHERKQERSYVEIYQSMLAASSQNELEWAKFVCNIFYEGENKKEFIRRSLDLIYDLSKNHINKALKDCETYTQLLSCANQCTEIYKTQFFTQTNEKKQYIGISELGTDLNRLKEAIALIPEYKSTIESEFDKFIVKEMNVHSLDLDIGEYNHKSVHRSQTLQALSHFAARISDNMDKINLVSEQCQRFLTTIAGHLVSLQAQVIETRRICQNIHKELTHTIGDIKYNLNKVERSPSVEKYTEDLIAIAAKLESVTNLSKYENPTLT